MIRLWADFMAYPLTMHFQNSLAVEVFLTMIGKKQTFSQFVKKSVKQVVSNSRPVFLLPIYSKIFDMLIVIEFINFLGRD